MTEKRTRPSFGALAGRLRVIHLAPLLAFLALAAWAFASPIGAGPDDDYHLVSTWCSSGGGVECEPGNEANTRILPGEFESVTCYAQNSDWSAVCQEELWADAPESWQTDRGNFGGEYPPVYYAAMHVFVGADLQTSALVMRLVNAAMFVGLATALAVLLPVWRRRTLLWGWLIALIPLGIFLIPSNNPSGWAVMGVGTAFLALLGWFESTGRRRWALGALYVVGVLMAAGSRGDAAVYVVGATATAFILTAARTRRWALSAILPAVGVIIAVGLFVTAGQSGVGAIGFTSDTGGSAAGEDGQAPLTGLALAAYNLLMLPFLWTGVWGTWGLGWFDTLMPAVVPWAATAAFMVVGFAGLGRLNGRKAVALAGVLLVLTVLPVYVLTVGGDRIGEMLQPRYLLPLIVLFAFLLVTEPDDRPIRFTRTQTFVVLGTLTLAHFVALHVNIRRYITGTDQQGPNLDAGAEWWWTGLPVGPTAVWVLGALAYAGLLVVLWPQLRRLQSPAAVTEGRGAPS